MSRRTIKSPEALAALNSLTKVRFAKRPALEKLMAAELGRPITDDQFEAAIEQIGRRILRVRGAGGGIRLF